MALGRGGIKWLPYPPQCIAAKEQLQGVRMQGNHISPQSLGALAGHSLPVMNVIPLGLPFTDTNLALSSAMTTAPAENLSSEPMPYVPVRYNMALPAARISQV